jgi:hypothetical protein
LSSKSQELEDAYLAVDIYYLIIAIEKEGYP